MGRELKRKEKFKNKNKKKEELVLDSKITTIGTLKIVGVVLILLIVLYFIIAIFVTKEINISNGKDNNNETSSQEVVNDKILASNIFKQKEEEYYVYFYDFKDEDASINSAISKISDKVYKVDTSSSLNSNYVKEKGNKSAKTLEDLEVISNTLIKIENDKIVKYYEGANEIIKNIK